MVASDEIKPGSRLRGLDPEGIAEVVQVARFGPDALNLVFRVNGRVGERLVYRGEETAFERIDAGRGERNSFYLHSLGRGDYASIYAPRRCGEPDWDALNGNCC